MTTMTLKQGRDLLRQAWYPTEKQCDDIADAIDAELKRQASAQEGPVAGYVSPDTAAELERNGGSVQIGTYSERYGRTVPVFWHPAERAGVRDGWKLVPVEPTPFMVGEGAWAYRQVDATVADVWKAMLAAAPVVFTDDGSSEAQHVADAERLNCPACGGSGHVGDVRGEAVAWRFRHRNGSGQWHYIEYDTRSPDSYELRECDIEDVYTHPSGRAGVPDVGVMVDRFLNWQLPATFAPDGWVRFVPPIDASGSDPSWPHGANLLTAEQADSLIRYLLAAAPSEDKP